MTIYFLTYVESDGIRTDQIFMDAMCGLHGYQLEYIDHSGDLDSSNGNVYQTLQEAWDNPKFAGYTWVYFDSTGATSLKDYTHPATNVVYVVGSDISGYSPKNLKDLNGEILKVNSEVYGDLHAAQVIAKISCDRYDKVEGA